MPSPIDETIVKTCKDVRNWTNYKCSSLVSSLDHNQASEIMLNVLPHPHALQMCYNPANYFVCDTFMKQFCSANPRALICGCYTGRVSNNLVKESQATFGCVSGSSACSNDCSGVHGKCHTETACSLDCFNSFSVKRPSISDKTKPIKCPTRMCVFDFDTVEGRAIETKNSCFGCGENCNCIVFNQNVTNLQCSKGAKCINAHTGKYIDCVEPKKPGVLKQVKDIASGRHLPSWYKWSIALMILAFLIFSFALLIKHVVNKDGVQQPRHVPFRHTHVRKTNHSAKQHKRHPL